MIGSMPFKKCPACGESNVDTATRCTICGAAINPDSNLPGGLEKIDAMSQATSSQPWGQTPAAPPPPPGSTLSIFSGAIYCRRRWR